MRKFNSLSSAIVTCTSSLMHSSLHLHNCFVFIETVSYWFVGKWDPISFSKGWSSIFKSMNNKILYFLTRFSSGLNILSKWIFFYCWHCTIFKIFKILSNKKLLCSSKYSNNSYSVKITLFLSFHIVYCQ